MKFNEDIESWVKSKISRRGEIDPVPEVLSALPSPRSVVDEQEMKSRIFFEKFTLILSSMDRDSEDENNE